MTFGPEGGGARVKTNEGATEIISALRSYGHTALDTARIYTDGNTEKMMGDLDLQGLTVDTKCFPLQLGGLQAAKVKHSLQESLEALKTDKVHVFYLHAPDYATPIQETLKAVDELYREGKFDVFGLSNYPAWVVAQIYYLCKSNGYVVPTVYQGTLQTGSTGYSFNENYSMRVLSEHPLLSFSYALNQYDKQECTMHSRDISSRNCSLAWRSSTSSSMRTTRSVVVS